jgi:hypothetical protein
LRVVELFDESRTVMTTAVLPRPTSVPATGTCVIELTLQLSVAVTVATKFATGALHVESAAALNALV